MKSYLLASITVVAAISVFIAFQSSDEKNEIATTESVEQSSNPNKDEDGWQRIETGESDTSAESPTFSYESSGATAIPDAEIETAKLNPEQQPSSDSTNNMIDENGKTTDPKELEEQEKTMIEAAEYQYQLEAINEEWRAENEGMLQKLFAGEDFANSTLNSVTCHTKTCRADVSNLSQDKMDKFASKFVLQMAPASAFTFDHRKQLDGSVSTIVYYQPANAPPSIKVMPANFVPPMNTPQTQGSVADQKK